MDSKQNEPANKAPVIAADSKVSLGADGSASWDLKASDAESDELTFSLVGDVDALTAVKNAVSNLKLVNAQLADGKLDYIKLGSFSSFDKDAANTKKQLQNLVDGNNDSCADFRKSSTDNNGQGGWFAIDFGEGCGVKAESFYMHCRTNFGYSYPAGGKQRNRFKHAYVEGSDDGKTWTRLTEEVPDKVDEATLLNKHTDHAYRYLRFGSTGKWYGNLGEMRINGTRVNVATAQTNELQSLTAVSPNADQTKAKAGDTVTLTAIFKGDVKQAGHASTVRTSTPRSTARRSRPPIR